MQLIVFWILIGTLAPALFLAIFFDYKQRCENFLIEIYTGEWQRRAEENEALRARCEELEYQLMAEDGETRQTPPLPQMPPYYDD